MRDVLTLAIETSNPSAAAEGGCPAGVAVGRGGRPGADAQVLGVEPVAPPTRHSDDLVPAIDRLMRRLGLSPRDLARVAVSVGPGGYTGLRIATSAAAMIAEATGAACVGVETERVAAARVEGAVPFAVVLASKGPSAWVRVFGPDRQPLAEGALADADAFGAACQRYRVGVVIGDRFMPGPFETVVGNLGMVRRPLILDPAACFEVSAALPSCPADRLVPRYPREPEAMSQWRRHNRA